MEIPNLSPIWEAVLDLVYPARCCVCDRIGEDYFCRVCRSAIVPVPSPFCERCQDPAGPGLCARCRKEPPRFALARSSGLFEGRLRSAIHAFKYGGRRKAAAPLAGVLDETWRREPGLRDVNALIALPIHRRREQERGFNQSSLLAEELGRRLGLPVLGSTLTRPIHRRPQVGLGQRERRANVSGVFQIADPDRLAGLSLLLIDDVLTTGATCSEAARALRSAGARDVCVLTLARESFRPPTGDSSE